MNWCMLKSLLVGVMLNLLGSVAFGVFDSGERDPTAPSPRILERLGSTQRTSQPLSVLDSQQREAVKTASKHPEIRLKALVFSDTDHASAILSANGRSILLTLSRSQLGAPGQSTPKSPIGFTLDGVFFAVEDFSDHTVVLRTSSDNSLLQVQ